MPESEGKTASQTENHPVRVVIGVPNEGMTQCEAYDNRMIWMHHLGILESESKRTPVEIIPGRKDSFEFFHFTAGRLITPMAREALVKNALQGGYDYILMVDDDMLCPIDMLEKLYRHDVDIVAPLAFTRNEPHLPVIYQCKKGWDPVTQKDYFMNFSVRRYPKNKLVRCDAVGFGAVLIKMSVFNGMSEPYFFSTCGTGEDVLFCYRAFEQTGAKTFVDTSVKLGHLARPNVITEEYAEWFWREQSKENLEKTSDMFSKYETEMREVA